MQVRSFVSSFLLLTLVTTGLSAASFTIQSGDATIITPNIGDTIGGNGTYQSDVNIFAFDEQQNVTLGSILNLDQTVPPTGTFSNTPLSPGSISASEVVSSHFFLADRVSNTGSSNFVATFKFNSPILMVGLIGINSDTNLSNSESELGLSLGAGGYIYNALSFVGGPSTDKVTISADRTELTLDLIVGNGGDFDTLRVVTQSTPVPEPETYLLMGGMVTALAFLARYRKAKVKS